MVYKSKNTRLSFAHPFADQAAVTLSPLEVATVCVGKSLEFTCNITGMILEWSFPRVGEPQRPYTRGISAQHLTENFQVIDNSTTYYRGTRISAKGSPVSSRLLISTVSNSHNGTAVICSDVSLTESASTIIVIIDGQNQGMQV